FMVPASNLIDVLRVPDSMSDVAATLIEPAACAVKALDVARMKPGDDVVIIGLGFMGQLLAVLARALGAGRVVGTDLDAWRRGHAESLGVTKALDPREADVAGQVKEALRGKPADVVIVGPPVVSAIQDGIACAGPGSRVVLFSSPAEGT